MNNIIRFISLFLTASWLVSCASYKKQYASEAKNWQQDSAKLPATPPLHIMYLIGDAGNDSPEIPAPVLKYLRATLSNAPKQSSALFMGDNIYEFGMPPVEDSAKREVAEYRITSQLETLDNYKGTPVFMPGNHDWRGWGRSGLRRQEDFIQAYINSRRGITHKEAYNDYFLPKNGCSGADVVELNNDVVLLVIDSEWWLRDWNKEPGMNDGCEVKNRAAFKFMIENVVRKYRNKNVVIAMHHPMYTYGSHGGGFSARQHLFPLTDMNPKLYVPLPVIGTLAIFYRSLIGSRQDIPSPIYQELKAAMLAATKKNGSFYFCQRARTFHAVY